MSVAESVAGCCNHNRMGLPCVPLIVAECFREVDQACGRTTDGTS